MGKGQMEQRYGNLSDEQLIEALRGGDREVMDYILNKYKPLVLGRANAMFLMGGDTDDLIQEGMIGLFKAIRDYRADRDASFASFAGICVSRQIYNAVEASNRKKNGPLNAYVSLYDGEEGHSLADTLPDAADGDPEAMVIGREDATLFWEELQRRLSPMERRVLGEHVSGLGRRQIAEKMGKSPKAIDNALSRIKAKAALCSFPQNRQEQGKNESLGRKQDIKDMFKN